MATRTVELYDNLASAVNSYSYMPFNTLYEDNRYDYIITASELTRKGVTPSDFIKSISFKSSQKGYRNLVNFRIAIKNTTRANYGTSAQPDAYSTFTEVYYNASYPALATDVWYTFPFSSDFKWDGTSNIMISVSRDDNGYYSSGGMYTRTTTSTAYLSTAVYHDSAAAFPYESKTFTTNANVIATQFELSDTGLGGGTPTYTDGYTSMGLTQQIYRDTNVNLGLTQGIYVDSSVNLNLIENIYNDSFVNLGLNQNMYIDNSTNFNLTQNIYRDSQSPLNLNIQTYLDSFINLSTRQEMYVESQSILDLIQQFYSDGSSFITLPLVQQIYKDSSANLNLKQQLYKDQSISVPLTQQIYRGLETDLSLIQTIYKGGSNVLSLHQTIYRDSFVNLNAVQKMYLDNEIILPLVIDIRDDLLQIIDSINLKGNQNLNVYLSGIQQLNIYLIGKQVLNVNLKGVIQ